MDRKEKAYVVQLDFSVSFDRVCPISRQRVQVDVAQ